MPYLVSYEVGEKAIVTSMSDDRAALRLAACFEAQRLGGVSIQDSRSGEVYSLLAFRLLRGGDRAGDRLPE